MRTIKFRAKRINRNGEWAFGDLRQLPDRTLIFKQGSYDVAIDRDAVDESTVCQFTGLLDKNGKEIYEGDILEVSDEMYAKVVWNKEKASFEYEYLYPTQIANTFYELNMPYLSIVGNIHDNPELMKGE